MNEMYVVSVLTIYVGIEIVNTLLNTYRLFTFATADEKEFIIPIINRVHNYVAPVIQCINNKKDYRLNMKCRPPILLVAH